MKRNLVPLLGIAFVVALATTGILYGLFAGRFRQTVKDSEQSKIVVAARNLPPGTRLAVTDFKVLPWPKASTPSGSYSSAEAVAGKTLVEPIQQNEPLTQMHITPKSEAGIGVPAGMRAVSVRISDSPGVVGLLRSGQKVDVQYVGNRIGTGDTELKTILQNLEVVAINPQAENLPNRAGMTVVTLLASPVEADLLSLADSNNRLRLTLRNPVDDQRLALQMVSLGALDRRSETARPTVGGLVASNQSPRAAIRSVRADRELSPAIRGAQSTALGRQSLALWIRFAGAQQAAAAELLNDTMEHQSSELLQVGTLRANIDLEPLMKSLQEKQQLTVFQASRITAGFNREVLVQASGKSSRGGPLEDTMGVRITFRPLIDSRGQLRLRVQPEITAPHSGILTTRSIATEVQIREGQSFLLSGLSSAKENSSLVDRLFPVTRDNWKADELLVIVTPRLGAALSDSAQPGAMP